MIKRLLPVSDLYRNISTLVVGTFLAQLVPMLLQALLRRLYPAEDWGAFAVFISITGILMVVASLRYEMAVVLPEKRSDAINLTIAGILSALVFNLVLLLVIWVFNPSLVRFLNLSPDHGFILYYLPAAIFLFSTYQVMNYYLVRCKAYKAVSINKISRRISEGAVHTVLGFAGKFSTGLIWGNIAGHVFNVLAGWIQMVRHGFSLKVVSLKKQWELMKKYREFPMYNLIPAFLNAVCMHFPLILVNKFYAQETTAYFDLAKQVLVLPASILALSISQVLLQNIAEKSRKQESISRDIYRILLGLGILAAGMVVIILLWAPGLFSLYAGEDYYTSGVYAQIIVAGAAMKLMVSPLSSIFPALKKIKIVSFWQAFYFLLICTLFLFREADIISFLKVYLLIDLIAYGLLLILIIRLTRNYEKNISKKTN